MSELTDAHWAVPFDDAIALEQPYGNPISGEAAAKAFGTERSKSSISALVLSDLKADFKPRRGTPHVTTADFLSSLVQAPDGRWFFSGYLNGWGALTLLELASLQKLSRPAQILKPSKKNSMYWNSVPDSKKTKDPFFPESHKGTFKAVLYLPKYCDNGFAEESPGLLWYYSGWNSDKTSHKFSYGLNTITATELHDRLYHIPKAQPKSANASLPKATMAHQFGHRYAKESETRRDRLTYHTGVFIEWDHGVYGSIVELAWQGGIGGYNGKSNWVEDRDDIPSSQLYKCMPAELKAPWNSSSSEIRFLDVPYATVDEFKAYMEKHSGSSGRFLKPKVKYSAPVILKNRTKPDIVRFILNRIFASSEYSEPSLRVNYAGYNCQTFAACFYGFLTGQSGRTFSFGKSMVSRQALFAKSFVDGRPIKVKYGKKRGAERISVSTRRLEDGGIVLRTASENSKKE